MAPLAHCQLWRRTSPSSLPPFPALFIAALAACATPIVKPEKERKTVRAEQSRAEPSPSLAHTQPQWRAPALSASRCSASWRRTPPSPRSPRRRPPRPPPPRPRRRLPPRRRPRPPRHRPPRPSPPPHRPQRLPPHPQPPPPQRRHPPRPPRHQPRLPPRRLPPRPPRPLPRRPRPALRRSRRPSPPLPLSSPRHLPPFPPSPTPPRPRRPRRRSRPPRRRRRARPRPPLPSPPRPPPSRRRPRPPRRPTTPKPRAPHSILPPTTPRARSRAWLEASCRRARWRWASSPSSPRQEQSRRKAGGQPAGRPGPVEARHEDTQSCTHRAFRTSCPSLLHATAFCAVYFFLTGRTGRRLLCSSPAHARSPRILSFLPPSCTTKLMIFDLYFYYYCPSLYYPILVIIDLSLFIMRACTVGWGVLARSGFGSMCMALASGLGLDQ